MSSTVPHRFLFRYSFSVRHVERLPKKGQKLLNLPEACLLPDLGELDGVVPFGELRIAWNAKGLGVSVRVHRKRHPPAGQLKEPTAADSLQLWIDTRNTQSIHRASRFCHHFCILPRCSDSKSDKPVAIQLPIALLQPRRARPPAWQRLLQAAGQGRCQLQKGCWVMSHYCRCRQSARASAPR